jgi:hypothetical protein
MRKIPIIFIFSMRTYTNKLKIRKLKNIKKSALNLNFILKKKKKIKYSKNQVNKKASYFKFLNKIVRKNGKGRLKKKEGFVK